MRILLSKRSFSAIIGAAVMTITVQAHAIEVNPYGSIKVGTFWSKTDSYSPTTGSKSTDKDFSEDLFGNSNIGVRAKESDFSAVFELGLFNPKAASKGPEIRLFFGDWDFGGGKIRVGKAPSPYVYRTQQVWDADGGMNGYGSLYDGRYPQIKLAMNNGFYFTIMQPRVGNNGNFTSNVSPANGIAAGAATGNNGGSNGFDVLAEFAQTGNAYATTYTNYDNYMPKIVTGYDNKLGIWEYGGGVAYNLYSMKSYVNSVKTAENNVHSYLVYFHGKVDLAPVELSYNVFTGRNVGDLMSTATGNGPGNTSLSPGPSNGAYFDQFNGINSFTYGGWGQIGYTLNDKIKFYTAASYVVDDNKISQPDDRMAAFIQMQYNLSKNFKIVPEIDLIKDLKNVKGQTEPTYFAAGAKWEMNF